MSDSSMEFDPENQLRYRGREYVSSVLIPEGLLFKFRFDFASDVEYDLGVEIETVLVVSAAALAVILPGAVKEPQHVKIREMILDALQRRKGTHGM